ncbi:unnamed protein product [Mytilus edulis]|uniref:C1q domain-containing protein n=1 Tax=Mytilus edulis TaxID=6550 RepID=A0A8S3UDP1_MYTED|nr:unnamed protein product [Mytilus edulis]
MALMNLKNIQPLVDLSSLKTQVQSVSSEIHALSVNDRARSEDFRALYNMSLISESHTKLRFSQMETNHNVSLARIQQALNDSEIHQIARVNTSITKLQQQMNNTKARVGITACVRFPTSFSDGSVVRFDNVRTNRSISNVSSFRNSGKFTSESEGLYLVSSWILSDTNSAEFAIYCNGNSLASAYIKYIAGGYNIGTATAVVVVELKVGDTVWVQTVQITMDSDDCGKAIDIYDKEHVKFAKDAMTTSDPNYGRVITIRSGYKDSNYAIEITPEMIDITNCGLYCIFMMKDLHQQELLCVMFCYDICFAVTMDSDVYCGKAIDLYDQEYVINARADMTTSIRPNYHCVITIRSGYTDSNHGIQITQQMIDINDCGIKLNIYAGSSPGGTVLVGTLFIVGRLGYIITNI